MSTPAPERTGACERRACDGRAAGVPEGQPRVQNAEEYVGIPPCDAGHTEGLPDHQPRGCRRAVWQRMGEREHDRMGSTHADCEAAENRILKERKTLEAEPPEFLRKNMKQP